MSRPRKPVEEHVSAWWPESDGTWRAKVAVGRRTNGRIAYVRPRRATKALIRKAVRDIEHDRDARARVWTEADPTLDEWTARWLDVLLPLKGRRTKTLGDYRSKLSRHILPHRGSLRLSELTVAHVQERYAAMAFAGASPHVVHGVHRVLMSCLNAAVRQEVLGRNPAAAVEVAKPQEGEVEPLSRKMPARC